jgi:hypothetical protein
MEQDGTTPTSKRKTRKTATIEVEGIVVGRDKKVIPPNEVFKLAALGCKDTEISDWFGIDSNTLRFNFSVELIKGREALKQSLRRAMLHNAIANNNAAVQIFLAKNILGMSDSPLDSEANAPLPWTDDTE